MFDITSMHDWEITGIVTDREKKQVQLHLKTFAGESVALTLVGVKKLIVSGMTIQNVILDPLLFDKSTRSDDFFYCCRKLGISPLDFDGGKSLILYLEPSVGAEIIGLIENVYLR